MEQGDKWIKTPVSNGVASAYSFHGLLTASLTVGWMSRHCRFYTYWKTRFYKQTSYEQKTKIKEHHHSPRVARLVWPN